MKVILGQEKAQGSIWISPSANVGYLTQEVFDLPLDKTPEQLFYKETFEERGNVQSLMKHLGFTAAQWTEPIGKMSMGERVKCKLMAFILEEKDVLILDEPTNHLDLPSREQLEDTFANTTERLSSYLMIATFSKRRRTSGLISQMAASENNGKNPPLSGTMLKNCD